VAGGSVGRFVQSAAANESGPASLRPGTGQRVQPQVRRELPRSRPVISPAARGSEPGTPRPAGRRPRCESGGVQWLDPGRDSLYLDRIRRGSAGRRFRRPGEPLRHGHRGPAARPGLPAGVSATWSTAPSGIRLLGRGLPHRTSLPSTWRRGPPWRPDQPARLPSQLRRRAAAGLQPGSYSAGPSGKPE